MYGLKDFLGMYRRVNTIRAYRTGVMQFLKLVYGRDKLSMEEADELSLQYLSEERDRFQDLVKYVEWLRDNYTPKSVGVKLGAVREWLAVNNWEPSAQQKRILRKLTPKQKVRSEEGILTREKIRRILQHLPIHGRALVLMLASSGMRLGEALSLHLEDVKLHEDPARVVVRQEYSKTGEGRVTFISSEAREALEEWLGRREEYIKSAQHRNNGLVKAGRAGRKQSDDNRVFPFSQNVAERMWQNALDKAGLNGKDRSTGRRKYRLHGLRKFFRSQLATALPTDVVEALMGHEGYLTGAYRKYTERELAEFYAKGEHVLLITPPESLVKAAHEVKQGLEKNRELVESLIIENKQLRERVKKLEEEMRVLAEVKSLIARLMLLEERERLGKGGE